MFKKKLSEKKAVFNSKFLIISLFLISIFSVYYVYAVGQSPAVDSPQTMVLFMKFNNDSVVGEDYTSGLGENIVVDYSSEGNNGTSKNNITYNSTGGYLGDGAFEFDGVNDYVLLTNAFNMTNSTSISFWIKAFNEIGDGTSTMSFGGIASRGINDFNSVISLQNQSDNNLRMYFEDIDGTARSSSVFSYNVDEWMFMTLVFDSERKMSYYLDGELLETETSSNSEIQLQYIGLGHGGATNDGKLNGSIDDFIFYNESLNSEEVYQVYQHYLGNYNLAEGCYYPHQDMVIKYNTIFCNGTYYLNGSAPPDENTITNDSMAVINISASNIVIDMNGATMQGNWTNVILGDNGNGSRTAFWVDGNFHNITIKNGIIKNYKLGLTHDVTEFGNNFILINMTFENIDFAVRLYRTKNEVYNSSFTNCYDDCLRFEKFAADENIIEYNTFSGGADHVSISSTGDNSESNIVRYNTFLNSEYKYGVIISRSNDNLVEYNTFNGVSAAIGLTGLGSNNIIRHNIITNTSNSTATYTECGVCYAIHQYAEVGAEDNLTIWNNTIYNVRTALVMANATSFNFIGNNITNSFYRSFRIFLNGLGNATIENNIFNNVTDIQFASGDDEGNVYGNGEYFVRNNTININPIEYEFIGNNQVNISFYGNYQTYILLNHTAGSATHNLRLYNLIDSLIFNTNGSIYGSSNIADNDGNINITLSPNEFCYVLDEFNLTNGITRNKDLINITSITTTTNSKTYHISSLIKDDITIPVYNLVVPDNSRLIGLTINPNGKASYTPEYTYNPTTKRINIPEVNLSYSTTSNEIVLALTTEAQADICDGFFGAGSFFMSFIVIIIVLSAAGFVLMLFLGDDSDMDLNLIVITIIIATIIIIFGMKIINTINGC